MLLKWYNRGMERPKIGRIIHERLRDQAIFWGRPSWAGTEARTAGLDEISVLKAERDAHMFAAMRDAVIHGNYGSSHFDRMIGLNVQIDLKQNEESNQAKP
jgi:hypothetical protein